MDFELRKLSEIADVINCKEVPSDILKEDGIPYLRARNLKGGEITISNVFVPIDYAKNYAKQVLQEGDILLSKTFGQHKISKVNVNNLPAIPSSNIFIIRPFAVNSDYLFNYLSSETGSKAFRLQLDSIEVKSCVPHIRKMDLENLSVPLFLEKGAVMDISNIRNLSEKDIIHLIDTLLEVIHGKKKTIDNIKQLVVEELHSKGWKPCQILSPTVPYSGETDSIIKRTGLFLPDLLITSNGHEYCAIILKSHYDARDGFEIYQICSILRKTEIKLLMTYQDSKFSVYHVDGVEKVRLNQCPTENDLTQILANMEENSK